MRAARRLAALALSLLFAAGPAGAVGFECAEGARRLIDRDVLPEYDGNPNTHRAYQFAIQHVADQRVRDLALARVSEARARAAVFKEDLDRKLRMGEIDLSGWRAGLVEYQKHALEAQFYREIAEMIVDPSRYVFHTP